MQTETSISGFLKDVSPRDFTKESRSIYSLKDHLIDFNILLTAPEFQPSDEPVSMFRIHDGLEIEEEEEKVVKKETFKDTLRNVLKKYKGKEQVQEVQEPKVPEEKTKIPDIGRSFCIR